MSKADQIRALRERRFEYEAARISGNGSSQPSVVSVPNHTASEDDVVNKAAMPESVAETVRNLTSLINSNAVHQAKWRASNLELNRQRARDGMRKRRAELKDNG